MSTMTTTSRSVVSLRRPLKSGDSVLMGPGLYTVTRIEGLKLFGILEGYPGVERCITADYRRPRDPRVAVTHPDGKQIQ